MHCAACLEVLVVVHGTVAAWAWAQFQTWNFETAFCRQLSQAYRQQRQEPDIWLSSISKQNIGQLSQAGDRRPWDGGCNMPAACLGVFSSILGNPVRPAKADKKCRESPHSLELVWTRLNWFELVWKGLNWFELVWTRLNWIELV